MSMSLCVYTIEFYLAVKKKEIMKFSRQWIGLENIKRDNPGSEKQIPYDLSPMQILAPNYKICISRWEKVWIKVKNVEKGPYDWEKRP